MAPRETRFTRSAVLDHRLVGCDLRVLALLGSHADARTGICVRSQRRMGDELGVTRETIMRSLTRLAGLGYIAVRRRRTADGGNASCEYQLLEPARQAELFGNTPPVTSTSPPPVTPASPPPESSGVTIPESSGDSTISLTAPVERKNTADDARAPRSSLRRRRKRATGQRELLLPINGGCRSASEPGAVPATPAGAVPPLKAVPSAEPVADAVPPDPRVPSRDPQPRDGLRARPEGPPGDRKRTLDRLEEALRAAAGPALHAVSTALMVLSDPQRWLDAGCDLERDVLPALRAVAARSRPGAVRTWGYFTEAVFEARDRRLAPSPGLAQPPPETRHGAAFESPTRAALRRAREGRW